MENQKTGYVPLYRSIKKKSWAKDVFLRTLWDNLLMEAARQPRTVTFKGVQWNLESGQLVVTANDLGLALCDRNGKPTSRDAVERMLSFFVKEGMISMEGEKRKGRVITILNYAEYAEKIDNLPAHRAAHKPAHHEQESNNKNIKRSSRLSGETRNGPSEIFFANHPEAIGGCFTQTGKLWGSADDLKAAKWIYSRAVEITPTQPEPSWPAWANEVRLLRTNRDLNHKQICAVFKWANGHHFWATNVLSPSKLRKQWDTLTAQMTQPVKQRQQAAELNWDNRDWADSLPPGTL